MKTVFDHLRSRLHAQAGLDLFDPVTRLTPLDLERQWSPEFEQLMRNRMKMGGLRPLRSTRAMCAPPRLFGQPPFSQLFLNHEPET